MSVRCCFLFGIIFAVHASRAMQLLYNRWYVQRCACSDIVNEVCGSDGVTYSNLCELDCASVLTPDLTLKYLGPCTVDYGYCYCPEVWNPVCASNGFTYSSACDLRCDAETYGEDVYVDFDGECPPEVDAPSGNDIGEEVVDTHEVKQVGLPCSTYSAPEKLCNATLCESEESAPLCGNDGITYKNYCAFCCTYFKNPDFKIVQKGDCNTTVTEEATTTETGKTEKKNDRNLKPK